MEIGMGMHCAKITVKPGTGHSTSVAEVDSVLCRRRGMKFISQTSHHVWMQQGSTGR